MIYDCISVLLGVIAIAGFVSGVVVFVTMIKEINDDD